MKKFFLKKSDLILLFGAGLLYCLFNTTVGLKSVVALTQKIIPGILSIQKVDGTLGHALQLQNIRYDNRNAHVDIKSVQINWQAGKLLIGKFWVNNIIINDVNIVTHKPNTAQRSKSTNILPGWIDFIHLQQMQVNDVVIRNDQQILVKVTQLLLHKNVSNGTDIVIHSPQGEIKAFVSLSYSPFLNWHLQMTSSDFNPGYFFKEWQSHLALNIESAGQWGNTNKFLWFNLRELHGDLRHFPVEGKGFVKINNDQLLIDEFKLTILNAQIRAAGKVDANWDLHWLVNVPNLGTALPGSQGKITSSGKITGLRMRPNVVAALQLDNLRYKNIVLEKVTGNLYSSIMSTALTLNVLGKNIRLAHYTIPSLHLLSQLQRFEQNTHIDTALYTNEENMLQANVVLNNAFDLSGKLRFRFNDLNNIIKSNDIKNIKGELQGEGILSGKLLHPQLKMYANLTNGHVAIPAISAELNNISIKSDYQSQHPLNLRSTFTVGDGKAELNGTVDFENPGLPVVLLRMSGHNLQINHLNEYKATFSPDLTLHYINNTVALQGKIIVPNAEITPKDFSTIATLPSEVVIVDQLKPIAADLPVGLTLQIKIALGKQVKLAYQNLQAQLKGELVILKQENSPATGSGELYTEKGKYTAYGHSLTIREGRLIYNGNLLTNPGLEIRATQKFKTVALAENQSQFNNKQMGQIYNGSSQLMVGILAKGTLKHPVITVFSDPAGMAQNDILSYLVFGTPRSQLSGTSSLALLNSLAATLNQNDSSMSVASITNKIKNTLKLNDFSIGSTEIFDPNTNQTSNQATVNIGKKLGKRVSVQYKVGIFTPVSILNLKYKINKRLAFQTEASSLDTGADLLYEFERD